MGAGSRGGLRLGRHGRDAGRATSWFGGGRGRVDGSGEGVAGRAGVSAEEAQVGGAGPQSGAGAGPGGPDEPAQAAFGGRGSGDHLDGGELELDPGAVLGGQWFVQGARQVGDGQIAAAAAQRGGEAPPQGVDGPGVADGAGQQQQVGYALVVGGDALGEPGGACVQLGPVRCGHLLQDAGAYDGVLDPGVAVAQGGQAAGRQGGAQAGLGDGVRSGERADEGEVEEVAADGEGAQGVDGGRVAQVAEGAGGVVADDLRGQGAQGVDPVGPGAVPRAGETVQHVVDDGRDAPGRLGEGLGEGGVPRGTEGP